MKIVSWNVNSIRARAERAEAWVRKHEPDVLALQETKVVDEDFPREAFKALGYHVETFGQKTYNGVAILSRTKPEDVVRGLPDDDEDAERRLLAATVDGVRIVNVYVPNGREVDTPPFEYKLAWLGRLRAFLDATATPAAPLIVLGDFNIAPDERDVYDPDAFRGHVHFHPREHKALAGVCAFGLSDLFREHHREGGRYSWWDYRQLGFPRNAGLRIDLILGTEAVAERSTACDIDRDERKGAKPSDHAPVWVDLAAS
ncbi:MAG: exodeoxyribonuclease III [Planctomycetes bacterium]|nr:exodeoxyribonuclease III [Planctomycetota bacterium]MCB9828729.1 exodeoxyribonuclease III [Planctomycetota bacterium]MCB9901093.1 exodeoxyribonuclease III [Planctomycetota bacterium]